MNQISRLKVKKNTCVRTRTHIHMHTNTYLLYIYTEINIYIRIHTQLHIHPTDGNYITIGTPNRDIKLPSKRISCV